MIEYSEWLSKVKKYLVPGHTDVNIQTLLQALEEEKEKSQKALQGWQDSLEREQELLNLCKRLLQELRDISSQQINNNQ